MNKKLFTVAIGNHRGHERIWLESKRFEQTLFTTGSRITAVISKNKITIKLGEKNTAKGKELKVSKIHSRNRKPVLDLSNQDIGKHFPDVLKVTVTIKGDTITIVPSIKDEALGGYRPLNNTEFVEFFAGGGLLTEALKMSGFKPIMAIEREENYVINYEANNPDAVVYQTDVLDMDYRLLPKNPALAVLGIPCTTFSPLRIDLMNERVAAGEPKEGWATVRIIQSLITAIDFMNPETILVEEVPSFRGSVSEHLFTTFLQAQGYAIIDQTILKGKDFGAMSHRDRYCLVMSKNADFKLKIKVNPTMNLSVIEDILEKSPADRDWYNEDENKTVAMLKKQEKQHAAKGRGFKMKMVELDDSNINTVSGDYARRRVTDPILHNGYGRYSFFTDRELARLHGLPDSFIFTGSYSTNCKIVGQGVLVGVFAEVGRLISLARKAA